MHTHEFLVRVGGQRLPAEVDAQLESVTVDQHIGLPTACTLRFHDPTRQVTTGANLRLGDPCVVVVVAGTRETTLFSGDIAGLEIQRGESGATFTTVRMFDVLHRLQRGRQTVTYQNVTYGDVVSMVLRRNSLAPGAVEQGEVHAHLSQVNESDWQFLRRLADDVGYVLEARDGKVNFGKPSKPGRDVVRASLSDNVLRVDVSVTDDEAVREVEVRGWDPMRKAPVLATTTLNGAVASGVKPRDAVKAPTAPTFVHASNRYTTAAHAKAAAAGIAANVADARGEVHALLRGDATLRPGGTLEVSGLQAPYDGQYTITQARHEYRSDEGYEVEVVAGSHRDRTLSGTIRGQQRDSRTGGVWPGVVTALDDPEKLGRVRVEFPWLDDRYESFWARVVYPGAGKAGRGMVWQPEVNDEVLVAFGDGEVEQPYVLGGLYNKTDAFDPAGRLDASTNAVDRRSFKSRTGHVIDLVDARGKEAIRLRSGDGRFDLSYDAAKGELAITCKAPGGMKLDTTGPLELQGQQVKVTSKTTMELKSNGPMTVKGAVIRLN